MTGIAQAQPYYDYNNYGPPEYPDNRYHKSYGNDYGYESQYQPSYKPDYKPAYPSYDKKDDRDKSKDSKSVDVKKIKCNNINININTIQGGTGNGDNGNQTNGNGNNTDGFKKINKDGFIFICINNNNNVVAGGGGGNQTIPPEPQPTCEECFSILSERVIDSLLMNIDAILTSLNVPHEELLTIGDLCEFLETSTYQDKRALLNTALNSESVPAVDINSILSCLEDLRIL